MLSRGPAEATTHVGKEGFLPSLRCSLASVGRGLTRDDDFADGLRRVAAGWDVRLLVFLGTIRLLTQAARSSEAGSDTSPEP